MCAPWGIALISLMGTLRPQGGSVPHPDLVAELAPGFTTWPLGCPSEVSLPACAPNSPEEPLPGPPSPGPP